MRASRPGGVLQVSRGGNQQMLSLILVVAGALGVHVHVPYDHRDLFYTVPTHQRDTDHSAFAKSPLAPIFRFLSEFLVSVRAGVYNCTCTYISYTAYI